jgi:C1A family cysteine protease
MQLVRTGRKEPGFALGRAAAAASVILAALAFALSSAAQSADAPNRAPKSREFENHVERLHSISIQSESEPGHFYGLIPAPVDLSHARRSAVRILGAPGESFPSSFDLRTASPARLTGIRNQGACGSCWAFAVYGSLESCLLPGVTTDFSENHMKNTHGYDWACCDGGNHYMATAYLARWSGPLNEASDYYNAGSCTSPAGLSPVKHIQDVDFLPDRSGSLDNDAIKQAVMTHGAVYTSLYMTESSPYYNPTTNALYYNGGSASNHAVCIVGWNDAYPRTNFLTQPPGDGAFIIKNSWGSGWGEGGFFYVSYYDAKVGKDNAVFISADPTANYDQVYDYDPLGWVSSLGYGSTTAWFANVFTATSSGELKAVSFYTASPNSSYQIYVYLDPDSGPLNTSGFATAKIGTIAKMGYHTIALDSSVSLLAGHRFSVVVRLTTPGYEYPIPFEERYAGYSSGATANPGESYISPNGSTWSDITTDYPGSNVCLKAFTTEPEGLLVSPGSGFSPDGPEGGPFTPVSLTYTLTNTSQTSIAWAAENTQPWASLSSTSGSLGPGASTTVNVSLNSAANALPVGAYTDTVVFTNTTTGLGNCTRDVTLTVFANYDIRQVPFQWIDPSSHSVLALGDDDVSAAQSIPFEFRFYDKPCSLLYVSANGMVGFAPDGLTAYLNADIPNASPPNGMLCPYWDDLNPASAGSVRIGTVGTAPNRKLVVSWVGVPHWSAPGSPVTFQVVLCEGSEDIVFQYLDVRPGDANYGGGRSATIGVENARGVVGTKYSYQGSTPLANRTALLFTTRGPEISTVKQLPDDSPVSIRRAVVTSVLGDAFYLESDDRSSGIRAQLAAHGLTRWDRADASGNVKTNTDGERYLEALAAVRSGSGSVGPLAMTGAALGGGSLLYDPLTGAGQKGTSAWQALDGAGSWALTNLTGLNNIGLLVKVCGRVTWSGEETFFVDDGSGLKDDSEHRGIRVYSPGLIPPPLDSYVSVTGISSCFQAGGVLYRRLLVSEQGDIQIL